MSVTGTPVVMVGAGDIASCSSNLGDEKTAAVITNIAGTVFTLGDNIYENATAADYANCYNNSWGQFKSRTRPTIGNHEYNGDTTGTATFDYYGDAAFGNSRPNGYYSYDLGAWHIVVLNSHTPKVSTAVTSPQLTWLRADLAATQQTCILAMWHHPRFWSSTTAPLITANASKTFWDALYAAGADLILNGHVHTYERFAPMKPDGTADPTRGIRQFIVGTGGRSVGVQATVLHPNSQVQQGGEYGVIKLTLSDGSYEWNFVPVAGRTFTDQGTANCHRTAPISNNPPPEAKFSSTCTNLDCTFTDQSTDDDGPPPTRSWNFGDGTPAGTATPQTHTYGSGGPYRVTLSVTDEDGASASTFQDITVTPANVSPTAAFDASCTNLDCTFTDGSTDSDGTIASSSWSFGDGTTSTATNPSHTYAIDGRYSVKLTVTDNDGATGSVTKTVTAGNPAPNAAPAAEFSSLCPAEGLTCTFADDGSSDSDGTVVGWNWKFGDGGTSTLQKPSHTYPAGGNYTVELIVTDNDGAASTPVTHGVTVTAPPPPPNSPPTAAFTSSCTNLSCTFTDGSTDSDGTIASRTWDFGDGTPAGASTPQSHTYTAAGTYSVKLTVTDNGGETGTVTKSVTVSAANVSPTAAFTSSCTNLSCTFTDGSTDSDGTIASRSWTFGDGTSSTATSPSKTYAAAGTYSVKLTVTDNGGATSTVTKSVTVSAANVSPTASFTSSCTGLTCTFTDGSTDSDGTIASRSWTFGNGTSSTATSPSKTYSAAGTYSVTLKVTDNKGATGTVTKSITVSTTANSAPKAFFGSSCARLACKFTDRSTDADGNSTIVKWSWAYGDGKTFTTTNPAARSPSYTYAAGGTYKPRLTVTDNKGATGSILHIITVTP